MNGHRILLAEDNELNWEVAKKPVDVKELTGILKKYLK